MSRSRISSTTSSIASRYTGSVGGIYAVINPVADKTDAERIKALQDLCAKLDALQKQAAEICDKATAEIERARRAGQHERRAKHKKVKRERRR
jgi:hypothetical protein